MSPALAGGFLTTAPPGKSRERFLMKGLVWGTLNLGCLLDTQVEILSKAVR